MRKYKYGLVIILSFLLCPITMKAAICSNADKSYYRELAKNIMISYEYREENSDATFDLTVSNIPEKFYLQEWSTKQIYPYVGSEMVISNLKQGQAFRFGIYVSTIDCDNNLLYMYYVNLPYYNPYHNDSLCNGIESFKFCNKWVNKQLTYDEFQNAIREYKKVKENQNVEPTIEEDNIWNTILKIYLDYYWIALPILIIVGVIVIKKYQKRQELF